MSFRWSKPFWDVDPFGGEMTDGVIWGRGALDMNGMGVLELMTFLLLKRQGIPLRRPVTFLAAADEEAGSAYGVSWLAEHRSAWLDTGLVINEGAYGLAIDKPRAAQVFQVAPAEKIPFWLKLTVLGRPGHGSVPHGDNCVEHLVAALDRVADWQHDLRITQSCAPISMGCARLASCRKETMRSHSQSPNGALRRAPGWPIPFRSQPSPRA